ncbi:hypothetical protein GCM10023185_07160 [Hymenobacter saemangeumensis]|uniref:Uncharacterized protein n=1 Tax=Hymenobacter saemangeumensis TaxID=1084522 RepID=A0ABP8I2M0_9BACT
MTPAEFAAFLRRAFQVNTWYGIPATERALRRVDCKLSPATIWKAAMKAGWAEHYAGNDEYCLLAEKLPAVE